MAKIDEALILKDKDRHYLRDHGFVKGKKMCVLYNREYYEDCPITDIIERTKSVEVYIPQLDKKVTVHYSMLDEGILNPHSLVDALTYVKTKTKDVKKAIDKKKKEREEKKNKKIIEILTAPSQKLEFHHGYKINEEFANLYKTLDKLRANKNWALAEKDMRKYDKTRNVKYLRRGLDHADKGEDLELLATAPHATRKEAKEYIKKRRAEIESSRIDDFLKNGVGKEFYGS